MSQKITCNVNHPPLGGLAAIELVKAVNPIAVEWGKESTISFGSDVPKFVYNSENDILRFIGRVAGKFKLYGSNPVEQTQIDQWLAFSLTLGNDLAKSLAYLEKCLAALTFLVTNKLTIADLAVFSQLSRYLVNAKKIGIPVAVQRWYNLIEAQECVKKSMALLPDDAKKALSTAAETANNRQATTERKQEGKFVDLPNAEVGKVIVRFPPEASGYLHIGHAKAALLNQHYANAFNGKLIMRFDDTNPAKETVEFEEVILGDLELLEIKPDQFTHTSNYFDLMIVYCEKMLKEGKAYVDDTEPEQMKKDREQRIESVHRNNSYEKNLQMWKEMMAGSIAGKKCCVRAKIDMGSNNGCMRDPTIYRCKDEEHPRTGKKYKVYPTYDFACPIVDAIEGVTHTLRTTEYHDRNPQFNWFIEALNLRRPEIYDYSRLNMTNTVLSKRRLTWFVDEGLVDGWDDPRFPTVRGILRRGLTVKGLREFIIAQGSSKSVVFMEWDKIWAFNKKVIDPIAPRYTALTLNQTVVINVAGVTKAEQVQVAAHPKNPEVGQKTIWTGPRILIDYEDAETLKEGENTTFINWGNLLIKKINRDASKKITSIDAVPNLENKDYKKTIKLTWLYEGESKDDFPPTVCVYFEHIISKPVLGKDEDFKQYVAKDTRREVQMLGDPELKKCKVGDIIQLQRRGYYRVDNAYAPPSPHTGKASPVILFEIPDGSQKSTTATPAAATKANATKANVLKANSGASSSSAGGLNEKIAAQGNIVRDLLSKKAEKAKIDAAVKTLLALKVEFKAQTGADWLPGAITPEVKPIAVANQAQAQSDDIVSKIIKQGDLVRDLKSKKADKSQIDAEVKTLLALKVEYKAQTGQDYKPGATPVSKVAPTAQSKPQSDDVVSKIIKQGDLVRDSKSKKADKFQVDAEVKTLLALKAEYKAQTGQEYKPGAAPVSKVAPPAQSQPQSDDIVSKIIKQGDLVRDLKSKKADKSQVDGEVKTLLALKAEYKAQTGQEYKPGAAPVSKVAPPAQSQPQPDDIVSKIVRQGDLVRDLKSKKADKPQVDAEVKTLLALKAEYKAQTGQDYKPGAAPVSIVAPPAQSQPQSDDIVSKIVKQGDLVRDLKSKKADKSQVDAEVKTLLALKVEYKAQTGQDYKPGAAPVSKVAPTAQSQPQSDDVVAKIVKQGDLVRDLKSKKVDKSQVDAEVKTLLALKAEYKAQTGQDYKPGAAPVLIAPQTTQNQANNSGDLNDKIVAQGNNVRDLKAQKADKSKIDDEVKKLLALKTEYKTLTGNDWKPDAAAKVKAATTATVMAQPPTNDAAQLSAQIVQQGNTVREVKSQKAEKSKIDAEVKKLLDLKAKYKALTGQDWKPEGDAGNAARSKAPKPAKEPKSKPVEKEKPADKDGGAKKVTRLGLEATKEDNLPEWYSQVLTKAELIEYYDVSGCYILRDWSFAVWKVIQRWFTDEIEKLGVKEVYFPMFVSKAALEKEKAHIADFSPEVAWVTKSGDSDLAEPVAIRPTSETVMYPTFAKWIQSYRDLPIKINQWSNVVRWEFKHPQPFLRTREFLWQEGHTAYEKKEDADAEVLTILDLYSRIYSDLLAVPTMKGRKTEKEKFAGGDYTTTVEAYISASGRAIQGGTSHHLGQNFSKMFEIIYEDPETKEKKYVYQNSWGLTTRTIGVMIMIHGDNKGLVLPPNVASIQAIIVPCGLTVNTKPEEKEELLANCKSLQATLKAAQVRVDGDYRDNYSPGWKFNHWELKGVPIRIELGPKDMKAKQLVAVRRDTGEKLTIPLSEVSSKIPALLKQIHSDMFDKAKKEFDDHIDIVHNWSDFIGGLSKKNLLLTPFCGDETCEKHIKDNSANNEADTEVGALAMGAKSLCIPFDQPKAIDANTKCINPNCTLKPTAYTLFGRSY